MKQWLLAAGLFLLAGFQFNHLSASGGDDPIIISCPPVGQDYGYCHLCKLQPDGVYDCDFTGSVNDICGHMCGLFLAY